MKPNVHVKRWGNSKAIRIPVYILEALNLKENSTLEISVDKENKRIILEYVDDELTPYQRLMKKNAKEQGRKQVIWDRVEEVK